MGHNEYDDLYRRNQHEPMHWQRPGELTERVSEPLSRQHERNVIQERRGKKNRRLQVTNKTNR